MRKILGLLMLFVDLSILPALLVYYIIATLDLVYGCAITTGNFKKEFNDYNEIIKNKIRTRFDTYKEFILG